MIITLIFWSLLYPQLELPQVVNFAFLLPYLVHSLPLSLTLIEWLLNGIRVELNQIWLQSGVYIIYGLINLVYTKSTGAPIYPILDWNSLASIGAAIGLLAFEVAIFLLFWLLTKQKSRAIYANRTQSKTTEPLLETDEFPNL